MTWYYEPGAQPFIHVWPPNVDLLQLNALAARSCMDQAAALRAEVQTPNMFEWNGSAATDHIADVRLAQRQIDKAIHELRALGRAMDGAVISGQAQVMRDAASYRAAAAAALTG
mgnify:FL=1